MQASSRKAILLSGALLALVVSACVGNRPRFEELAPVSRPEVERLGELLRVRWPASFALGAVSIYAGTDPTAIPRHEPIARTWGLATAATVEGLDPGARYYLELVPNSDRPSRIVAERRLPLDGTDNFRDIGGYETGDGHQVRWGLLYRSNNLAGLSNEDMRYLSRLRVQLVCDFRSEPERVRDPNRSPTESETAELTIQVEGVDPNAMQERIRTGVTGDELERVMISAYRSFVTQHGDQWTAMFDRLANTANLPTIVHCTAGKDRTGFASAMVLSALGVPKKAIFDDYMATNEYRADYNRWIKRIIPIYSLFRTRGDDLAPLLDARRPYLQASFDAIDEKYGSVDAYLEHGLGVTPEDRDHLRRVFLR